ncbi:crotonase/enoyl-CoA hydratase family protein [Streptomyces sp. NPDC005349]|uniref:crotonase/enoyl-CoA hydratase family protein n=1 Tax=Streptomyces sp. NPDC005349 TaxID=3157037 RepID=UPI0033B5515E
MERVLCRIQDGVADVRLNRTDKLNALDDALFADLIETGERLRENPEVRAVVLSGEGRAFCVGLDFSAFSAQAEGRSWRPDAVTATDASATGLGRGQRAVWLWRSLGVPVIAAVHGYALGGGLQLALGADLRLTTADAKWGVLELDWGLAPDMCGSQILPRLVGPDRAMELALTARKVDGSEAVRMGMATRSATDPREEALAMARAIAGRNPKAVAAIKHLVNTTWDTEALQSGFRAERVFMEENVGSPEQRAAARSRLGTGRTRE